MLRFIPRDHETATQEMKAKLHPYTGVMASLLWSRGVETAEDAQRFLHPSTDQLHDPYLLGGMREAVALLEAAKAEGIKTVVYGDYDTDGICAASLLTQALRDYGVDAAPYLPLRDDGYGLHAEAVEELSQTYRLLITVDLGITNADEVALAKSLGMQVIVTDHHELGLTPCSADAVIDPLMNDYPFPYLCGAGVAYKLACALCGADAAAPLLPLAAVATIADIVSMTGENRVIAALGLPMIERQPGLKAMLDAANITPPVDEGTVGFQLAPRLNAAGRVGDANLAVRLLMTDNPAEANAIAAQLDAANTQRKRLEAAAVQEAMEQVRTHNFVDHHMLFVRGAGWHKGVIGLVAGRLNRRYSVPVCALSEEDGQLHGSLRGVRGVNLADCLKQCDDLLIRYGGHAMAAGVTLRAECDQDFRARMEQAVSAGADPDAFIPAQAYDVPLNLEDADLALIDALEALRPFGVDNPAPMFFTGGAQLESRRACGMQNAHLQLRLRQNKTVLSGIAFGMGGEAALLPDEVDAAYTLERNAYRGKVSVQCHVSAIRPDAYARRRAMQAADEAPYQDSLLARLLLQAGKPCRDGENYQTAPLPVRPLGDQLLEGRQGTLYVAYTKAGALKLLNRLDDRVDVAQGTVTDPRCFHTLLIRPDAQAMKLSPYWKHILLLDGALSAADQALWQAACENAVLIAPAQSAALREAAAALDAGDDRYRALYKLLRRSVFFSLAETAQAAGLMQAQTRVGLHAFDELHLIRLTENPFSYTLLPAEKCVLGDSPLLGTIRRIAANDGEVNS
ncbi:MAG TPA: single-stranded-DNA-specific exonuclease RecJ [Candidatus Limiplasma sp.]|nr:single-stranded-DNA-specific exonuclease RecJ [Candidatus Limiplasma sp.]